MIESPTQPERPVALRVVIATECVLYEVICTSFGLSNKLYVNVLTPNCATVSIYIYILANCCMLMRSHKFHFLLYCVHTNMDILLYFISTFYSHSLC